MSSFLEVNNIEKKYISQLNFWKQKEVRALHPISFTLNEGETLAIIGEAGSGKSTLAKILAGAEVASGGDIFLDKKEITETHSRLQHQQIRLIFQDAKNSLNPNIKVGKILSEPLNLLSDLDAKSSYEKIRSILLKVGLLPEHTEYYPHMFSGGQLQRIALARAIIVDPKVLILDEAIAALDPSIRAQIINLLLDLQLETQVSYILITHHLSLVKHMSDYTMVLKNGQVVEYNQTAAIFTNPSHDYTKKLLASNSF